MKTQLVILTEQSIIVSDEEIKLGDLCYNTTKFRKEYFNGLAEEEQCKIIAGTSKLPSIDYSALSDEDCKKIGYVDIEKLADTWLRSRGLRSTTHCDIAFIEGFNAAKQLNDKEFSKEDLLVIRNKFVSMLPVGDVSAWDMITTSKNFTLWFDEYVDFLSKPKVFNIEVETYIETVVSGGLKPVFKISDKGLQHHNNEKVKVSSSNSIKILKIQ